MTRFLFFIDSLSTWVGKAFAWLILVLTLGVSYEVFVRYALRAPTTWAFDFSYTSMSVRFKEVSIFSPAGVPVFPLKALIPITGVLLFIQGVAEVIRCILCIKTGAWPQRLHDVEE